MHDAGNGDARTARRWPARAAAVAFALFALVAEAVAQDAAPAPAKAAADPLQAEVDAIHALGFGKSAKDAVDRFFTVHNGDPRVLVHLPAIESHLCRSLFRLSGPQPSLLQLLGRGATKYESGSSRAEFKITQISESGGWTDAGDGFHFLDALFDGEVAVMLPMSDAKDTTVFLGFDSETRGGFAFVPVDDMDSSYRGSSWTGREVRMVLVDPALPKPRDIGYGARVYTEDYFPYMRYQMSKGKVGVGASTGPGDASNVADHDAGKFKRGFVALKGPSRFGSSGLVISGKLEAAYAKRQIAEEDARRFRNWRDAAWNRQKALPSWVLAMEDAGRGWASSAPDACPAEFRSDLAALMRAALDGAGGPQVYKAIGGLQGAAADWQDALVAFGTRRHADAEAAARKVIDAEPKFAAARVLAGRTLLARGQDAAAVALFEEARAVDPKFAPAFDGLALAAFNAGDLARMQALLTEEAALGLSSDFAEALRQILFRVRRGPDWKKRFDAYSTNYAVSGDASFSVCNDIAKTLEEAADVYSRTFRVRPRKTRGRVRVFSGFESYADYVSDFGGDPRNTLGVYRPSIRELCIWLHEDKPELSNTIRHEGFHQYLHDFLDDVPIWFNEGYAEYFGFSRRLSGKAVVGQVGEDQAAIAKKLLPKFTPLAELFVLEPKEFMAKAGVHYVQSWAVVHLLRETSNAQLKGVLDRYFDALLAGKSQKEAYDAVLAPLVSAIERELSLHVRMLATK
jgi:tetratricopeptide (TPR) repeat protein